MIARSTLFAVVALLLSLTIHLLGLFFTWQFEAQPDPQPSGGETTTDIAAPGSTFEDLVETVSEPIEPEPAPQPEPPVEAEPIPDTADIPTTEALIASETPQNETTPDTGTAQAVEPQTTGPSPPEAGDAPEPTTIEPAGAQESAAADPALTPPAGTDTITAIPQGEPNAPAEPTEAPAQTAAVTPSTTVPAASAPVPPVAVAPVTPSVPAVSLLPSEIQPQTPPVTVQPEPEPPQDPVETVDSDISETATITSLRPRLPTAKPSFEATGIPDGSAQTNRVQRAPAPRIQSPLTAFRRDGVDIFAGQGGGARSGGQNLSNALNTGNSSVTNYAGRVLAQLNRTAPVAVSGRGWARVLFQIKADGTLGSVVVVDSSGSSSIDRAAQRQVRSAGRFPPPPDGKSRRLNFFYRIR